MRAIVLAAALVATPATATTPVDGSFEIQGVARPVTNYCYNGFATPGGPACAAGAWGPDGCVILTGSGAWGSTITPAGEYFGFVQGASVVSQTFTSDANATGVLCWIDTNRTNNGGLQSYDVTLSDGTSTILLGSYTSNVGPWLARSSSSFALVNGTTYTLSFTGLSQEDRTSFIDSIALSTTAVPEPTTWAMLVTGFGLAGLMSRRRRRIIAA